MNTENANANDIELECMDALPLTPAYICIVCKSCINDSRLGLIYKDVAVCKQCVSKAEERLKSMTDNF
jgi:hypothetical protein